MPKKRLLNFIKKKSQKKYSKPLFREIYTSYGPLNDQNECSDEGPKKKLCTRSVCSSSNLLARSADKLTYSTNTILKKNIAKND